MYIAQLRAETGFILAYYIYNDEAPYLKRLILWQNNTGNTPTRFTPNTEGFRIDSAEEVIDPRY